MNYDVVFIGGGPGGYVGAIKAALEGLKVALIEKEKVGGTCLMCGCIPTKTLIKHADVYRTVLHAQDFGIDVSSVALDYNKVKLRKDRVVNELWQGVKTLLTSHGVDVYAGEGSFVSPSEVKVLGKETKILGAKHVVIATGSIPASLPNIQVDRYKIHDSTSILEMTKLPKKMIVLGAGYIGCEFASLFSQFGVDVAMCEFLPGIVWMQGKRISDYLTKKFTEAGIHLHTGVYVERVEEKEQGVKVHLSNGKELEGDILLVSVGRKPYTEGLRLEKAGLGTNDRGFIEVDAYMKTNVFGIYAIGDVTGKSMLAHSASHQAMVAVENILGKKVAMNYDQVPAVIFTHPEIATVGMTLEQAKERGFDAVAKSFPFVALGKAKAGNETDGYAEIVIEKKTGRILGAFMIGHEAGNMIGEMTLAITQELTIESIAETIHPHPTLSEAWPEAAFALLNQPIHMLKTK